MFKPSKSIKPAKTFGVPALMEHNAPGAMQVAANDWKRKSNSVHQGKGCRSRTNLNSKEWLDNYDTIFGKAKDE
jgi:hypothetical protein